MCVCMWTRWSVIVYVRRVRVSGICEPPCQEEFTRFAVLTCQAVILLYVCLPFPLAASEVRDTYS